MKTNSTPHSPALTAGAQSTTAPGSPLSTGLWMTVFRQIIDFLGQQNALAANYRKFTWMLLSVYGLLALMVFGATGILLVVMYHCIFQSLLKILHTQPSMRFLFRPNTFN